MTRTQPHNEDYAWLLDALGGPGRGAPSPALARPSADRPELFLPLASRRLASGALRRFHDGRSTSDRLKTRLAIASANLGLLPFAPGDSVEIGPFSLIDEISDRLDVRDLCVAITLGPRRRNRKPVLQLLRPDGTTVGFAKVGWSPFTTELVGNEATWLNRLQGRLPDDIQIPRVLDEFEHDGKLVVITSPLDTSRRSGIDGRLSSRTITRLARSLGTARTTVADLPYLERLRTGRVGQIVDLAHFLEIHGNTEIELGAWHGDLTPWNTSTADGVSRVWDWEFADEHRPVGFDLLHNAFELVRRSAPQNEVEALRAMRNRADAVLAPLGQPSDTVVDLYLCELIDREARLRGEGWDPADLGPLDTHAAEMLQLRLRRHERS